MFGEPLNNFNDSNFEDEDGRRQDEEIEKKLAEEEVMRQLVDAMETELSDEYQAFMKQFPNFDADLMQRIKQEKWNRKADLN